MIIKFYRKKFLWLLKESLKIYNKKIIKSEAIAVKTNEKK